MLRLSIDPLAGTTQGRWSLDGVLLNPLAGTTQGRWESDAIAPAPSSIPLRIQLTNFPFQIQLKFRPKSQGVL